MWPSGLGRHRKFPELPVDMIFHLFEHIVFGSTILQLVAEGGESAFELYETYQEGDFEIIPNTTGVKTLFWTEALLPQHAQEDKRSNLTS